MCDHNIPPPIKKVASLSTQILDYYNKFGQNRDLERYLRLRQNYNKSSSEGSISTPSCASRVPSRESKSLDQLNFVKGTSSGEEIQLVENEVQVVRQQKTSIQNNADTSAPVFQLQPEIKMKARRCIDKPKKSYTFSCESNIAINLPFTQTASMPELVARPETSTEYSQTEFDEQLNQSIGFEEENISQTKSSPENILKSVSKRLEWDSLGDVGYDKNTALSKKQSRSMSTLERSVLTDFFGERGIEIKFNLKEQKTQDRLSKIQEESPKKSSQGAIPKAPKERWRETFESIKEKYSSNQSSSINGSSQKNLSRFRKLSAEHHSTPKAEILEKYCQTSFIKTQTKEIQVDFSNCGSIRSTGEADAGGSITSQSSFEYFPNKNNIVQELISDKENISPQSVNSNDRERKVRQIAKRLLRRHSSTQPCHDGATDLELGIKLLCSLIESKSFNDKQKKTLARQIVSKITKSSLPISENSTSNSSVLSKGALINSANRACVENVSGIATLSSSTSTRQSSTQSKPASEDSKHIETSRQILDILSENRTNDINNSELKVVEKKKNISNNKTENSTAAKSENTSSSVFNENKSEDKPINNKKITSSKTENDQDNTMTEWLDPLTKSEFEYNRRKNESGKVSLVQKIDPRAGGDCVIAEGNRSNKLLQFVKEEKKSHLKWIENEIERLENLKHLLLTNDDSVKEKDLVRAEVITLYPVQVKKLPENGFSITDQDLQQPSSSSKDAAPLDNEVYDIIRAESEIEVVNATKNYRKTIKKITTEAVKRDENSKEKESSRPAKTTTFSIEEEKRFPKADYRCSEDEEKIHREERSKLETPKSCASESIRCYAKQRKEEFLENYRKTPVRLYDQPAESDHYSEPKETGVKQRFTTSNAYTSVSSSDFFISSDSVSIPISGSSSTTTTTHQYDNRVAIGIQTTDSILRTQPIYSTRFPCGCVNRCECKHAVPTIRVYRPKPNKQVQVNPPALAYTITFENASKKSDDSQGSEVSLTLQEHLEKRRPDFQHKASQRQWVLKKMHKMRNERDGKIREIVENTSISSIPRKLKDIPPPPTKYTRVFPTKEMKAITRRKYKKLPEVIEKVEKEKKERRKRSNKVLADMFNRRLQRRVHKGKLTLEHSRTVI